MNLEYLMMWYCIRYFQYEASQEIWYSQLPQQNRYVQGFQVLFSIHQEWKYLFVHINRNIYLYIVTFSSCHYLFSTTWMICWIIRIALFCMFIIVRYMCSTIRIFLITVMVVLLYVCLYHGYFYWWSVYFLYFNIHRLYIIFLSIYQVKCGFHPTRKRARWKPQIYNHNSHKYRKSSLRYFLLWI